MEFKITDVINNACYCFPMNPFRLRHNHYRITAIVIGGDPKLFQYSRISIDINGKKNLTNEALLKKKFMEQYNWTIEFYHEDEEETRLKNSVVGKVIDP